MALADKALVGCALWAKAVGDEVAPAEPAEGESPSTAYKAYQKKTALARAVVAGRYDARVKDYLTAFYGDDDTTIQATVTTHCANILAVFLKLGLS